MEPVPIKLSRHAYSVKRRFLAMYRKTGAGHIGCSLSCAEILVFVKFAWMKEDDLLLLSKGHAAGALYSVLAEAGDISESDIQTFYQDGTVLAAHPTGGKIPGVPFGTGSLGHGLSLCAGMALASRLKNENRYFFCVTSDGELNEGSVWEAALFVAHHKLTHLIWFIDRNNIQGFGRTEDVLRLEPLEKKLEALGFKVLVADGHNFESLLGVREKALALLSHGKPLAVICRTVKGNGISFMKNTVDCHYLPMNAQQYDQALAELEASYQESLKG
jgi:transketolase